MRTRFAYEKGYWVQESFSTHGTCTILESLPPEAERAIALLVHLEDSSELEGVGYKVMDGIYYLD